MAGQLLSKPIFNIEDANGDPVSGGKAYFYLTGTTTPATVYTDALLSTPAANPVVANSAGRFAPIYLDRSVTYKLIVKDASDVTVQTIDPLNDGGFLGDLSRRPGKSSAWRRARPTSCRPSTAPWATG